MMKPKNKFEKALLEESFGYVITKDGTYGILVYKRGLAFFYKKKDSFVFSDLFVYLEKKKKMVRIDLEKYSKMSKMYEEIFEKLVKGKLGFFYQPNLLLVPTKVKGMTVLNIVMIAVKEIKPSEFNEMLNNIEKLIEEGQYKVVGEVRKGINYLRMLLI